MAEGGLTFTETRRVLEEIGLRPKKSLGQNFLIDGNIVRKSLDLAEIEVGDPVVEVGPGLGTLTGALLEAGCLVHAVEKDPHLFRYLKETLAQRFPSALSLMEGDGVQFRWPDSPPLREKSSRSWPTSPTPSAPLGWTPFWPGLSPEKWS
jgi:16S rRNA (adenine1518-N6/adenine1519-N6)-dimethyltransferase